MFVSDYIVEDLGIHEDYVYDLEVEDNHNFFANDICVHNSAMFTIAPLVDQTLPFMEQLNQAVDIADNNIQKVIDESFKEFMSILNHKQRVLEMARECVADSGFFVAKKRYALNVWDQEKIRYQTPHQKITGLEAIKSSTPRSTRDALRESITIVLQKSEQELRDYIKQYKDQFNRSDFELIATPSSGNNLKKYASIAKGELYIKGCPIQTRASLLYNSLLMKGDYLSKGYKLIDEGEKIKFIYLKMPNPSMEDVIALPAVYPPDLEILKYIDFDRQYKKVFIKPLQSITDVVGWVLEPQTTLEQDLFSAW